MSESYADIANRAADHMERVGSMSSELWPGAAADKPYTNDGPVCMLGAISVAQGNVSAEHVDDAYDTDIAKALDAHIRSEYPEYGITMPTADFNDCKDHEDRVQMLRDFAIKNQPDSMWG